MNNTKLFILILLVLGSFGINPIFGQERFEFPNSVDLGLNITNLLSSFIGNSNSSSNLESFPIVVKLNRKKSALRFGLGLALDNSDADLVSVEQFVFNNYGLSSRIGFERKKYLGFNMGFYYGLDLVSEFYNREDAVSNDVDVTTISENGFGAGGGPVFGFEYYLGKKVYLGTEGTFYTIYNYTIRKESFEFNSASNTERISTKTKANITVPSRLYIMVRF